MKYRLVILDANVIIAALGGGFWQEIVNRYEVHVSSIILREVQFYYDKDDNKVPVDLIDLVNLGKITQLQATPEQLQVVSDTLTPNFIASIDPGEFEVLALMVSGAYDEFMFCTGDMRAITGLSVLSLGGNGISLEEVLGQIGLGGKLPDQSFSKAAFQKKLGQGLMEQSMALQKKPKK